MVRMVRAEKAMYPDFDSVVAQTEAWWERQPKPTLVMNFDVGLSVGDQRLRGILKVDQFFATDWVLQHQRPPRERDLRMVSEIMETGPAAFFDERNFPLLSQMKAAGRGPHSNTSESIVFGGLSDIQIEALEEQLLPEEIKRKVRNTGWRWGEKKKMDGALVRANRLILDRLVKDSTRPEVVISVEGNVFVGEDLPIVLEVCLNYLHRSLIFSRRLVLNLIPFEEARVWIEMYEGAAPIERSRKTLDFVNSLLDGARLDVL